MKLFSSKKRVAAIGALTAATLLGGGMAYGYWTSTGSGTGSATVGTAENNVTVAGTTSGVLVPDGPSRTVTFTASNPGASSQKITTIHLDSITPDAGHAGCATVLGTDYSMADVAFGPSEAVLAPGASGDSLPNTGTLQMLDSGVNQDACQGATLTLNFTTT